MGKVPDDEDAGRMRRLGDARHVEHPAGAVVDMREHENGDVVGEGGQQFVVVVDEVKPMPLALQRGQPLGHVEVGGEVGALRDDDVAPGVERQRGGEDLEEVDRRGIGHDDVVRARPDERCDLGTRLARQPDPVGGVPGCDEIAAPFRIETGDDALAGAVRHGAERVAVEIDEAVA